VIKYDGIDEELLELDDEDGELELLLEVFELEEDEIELEVELGNSPPLQAPRSKANAMKVVILNLLLKFIFPPRINNLINILYKTTSY
jgi:hypothetical protein